MIDWISVSDKFPDSDCMAYVCNSRCSRDCFLVIFDSYRKVWRQYDPKLYNHPALEVTHYIELPYCGPLEDL